MKNKSYLLNGRNNCVCTHINLYTYIDSSSLHHPIHLAASYSSRSSSIIWVIELPRSQTLSIVVIRASEQVKYRNEKEPSGVQFAIRIPRDGFHSYTTFLRHRIHWPQDQALSLVTRVNFSYAIISASIERKPDIAS